MGDEEGLVDCKRCTAGKYSDSWTSLKCKACASGFFQEKAGQKECDKCPVGKYSNNGGETNKPIQLCQECVAGRFASSTNQTSCADCPPGKFIRPFHKVDDAAYLAAAEGLKNPGDLVEMNGDLTRGFYNWIILIKECQKRKFFFSSK